MTNTVHSDWNRNVPGEGTQLDDLYLPEQARKIVLVDKRGMMSSGGGYFPGLVSENTQIVDVRYDISGTTTKTELIARQPGRVKMYYINRAVFPKPHKSLYEYGEDGQYLVEKTNYFYVQVGPAGGSGTQPQNNGQPQEYDFPVYEPLPAAELPALPEL
ncbi:hypothetical protein [Persicirhabdus sediminis]|uniref:Uncharacterized protein n=1 Tax=Persicirhabdus sediminis TaxID=454144 RepID=A0A8J7M9V3_9BACT|nr:hypothetical protein [Persicirhabdus sediminis]MBK1789557.1 hypothetical protein [Persicirhabdus sediminis]